MFTKLSNVINNRIYTLYHNNKKLNFEVKRIKSFKDYFSNLVQNNEFKENKCFFIYNEDNIVSFGLSKKIDVVWSDWDGKITHIEESFDMNKISKKYESTKFIYIFPINSIKKNKILNNDILIHKYKEKNKTMLNYFIQ